jgi:hypothetical protein
MLLSNLPFVTHQSPLGDATRPSTMSLSQWMSSPVDFQDAVLWKEDMQPEIDFMYGPNSKSRRYKMYNRGIQGTFNLPTLLSVEPTATVAQQVARGLYPPVLEDMDAQARTETLQRLAFLNERMQPEEAPRPISTDYFRPPLYVGNTTQFAPPRAMGLIMTPAQKRVQSELPSRILETAK